MKFQYNSSDWIVWEQNCAPFFLVMTLNPSMKELREYLGTALFTTLIDFGYDDNGNYEGKWLLRFAEGNNLGQKMTDLLLCKSHRFHFDAAVKASSSKLIQKAEEIYTSDKLNQLTTHELINLYKELQYLFYNFYKYGAFVEPLQWYTESELNKYIAKNNLDEKSFMKSISSLSTESFSFAILKDFYNCISLFKKIASDNRTIIDIWNKRTTDAANKILNILKTSENKEEIQLYNIFKQFCAKYYWKMNNYYSTYEYTPLDLIKEIFREPEINLNDLGNSLKTKIQIAENEKKIISQNKNKLIKDMSAYYKNIVGLAELAAELSDMRKRIVMKSNSSFDKILMVLSDRTSESLENIHLLLPQEIEHFVFNPLIFKSVFEDRKKAFLVIQSDFPMVDELISSCYKKINVHPDEIKVPIMNDPFTVSGDLVEHILNQIDTKYNLLDHTYINNSCFSGTVTYKGEQKTITGVAHIIKDPKNETISEGEILIAPSTTPDFIASIQKCIAIVTDWGGQTSHAAIVSREFKKPCIIGTNFASQFISTGDIVQLNFDTGAIRVLKNRGDHHDDKQNK